MMRKRLLSTLLTLCIVLALLPVTALAADTSGSCGDNVTWSYKDGTLTIEGAGSIEDYSESGAPWYDYAKEISAIKIDDKVSGIGDHAFAACNKLTSVSIPKSVASVGENAFRNCTSLSRVTISDGVEVIGDGAFSGCESLTSVSIPDSVHSIGDSVFSDCTSLTNAVLPSTVTRIGDSLFSGCKSLTSVTLPDSIGSYTSSAVLSNGFRGCSRLTSVTIPEGVTNLGWGAFENCSRLAYVVLPESLTSVDSYAFHNCPSLTDVYYAGSMYDWFTINIASSSNEPLLNAVVHYDNGVGPSSSDPLSTQQTPSAPSAPSTPSTPSAPEAPATPTTPPATDAKLSPQKLTVDGKDIACEKYNIGGSNYFKLRDLAQLLTGTGSQFGVGFDEATSTVSITTGQAYASTGTELKTGADNSGTAQPSSQAILINGTKHSELTVYNIGGSNFFQLRELGNLLNFEVDYDASTNTAIVRSKQNKVPDRTEDVTQAPAADDRTEDVTQTPAAKATLANGKAITDENIREIIYGLKSDYPEGMRWNNDNYYLSEVLRRGGYGCEGFGLICSDAAFGDLPISSTHSNFDDVKVGDLLRINNDTHTVIVLEKKQNSVIIAEGNYNNSIHWGREVSRQSLEAGNFTVRSRYPA